MALCLLWITLLPHSAHQQTTIYADIEHVVTKAYVSRRFLFATTTRWRFRDVFDVEVL